MTTTTKYETDISVDEKVPLVRIIREFDAPVAKVYRAHVDPEIYAKWVGPGSARRADRITGMPAPAARTGTSSRATASRPDSTASFHELRENELIVQTFSFEGMPDGVALEKLRFEDLGDGRTRLTATSLVDSFEDRDAFVASGMESGVVEGYAKLDALLAQ